MPETSIIIRTRNEERWVGRVLERLYRQSYKNFEVIVIDSGSTDQTLSIVSKFPVKLIKIKPEEFSYPYALNVGARESTAEKYLVMLSAHSLPISDVWLESGIDLLGENEQAIGVYGPLRAMPDGTFWDKLFHDLAYFRERIRCFPKKFRFINNNCLGILGFTNAIVRKKMWEIRGFNEDYGSGGEDGEWARFWLSKGCFVIKDLGFTVRHSHYLGLSQWLEQRKYWIDATNIPKPFKYLEFRNDGTHKIQNERNSKIS